jgi:hypothetical protein
MPSYTNLGVDGKPPRKVCQYCGRPLKACTSLNQGCGDTCRQKNRGSRYRLIDIPDRKEKRREW